MNSFKLFIAFLTISVVFVSCSKTELFQEENSRETASVNSSQKACNPSFSDRHWSGYANVSANSSNGSGSASGTISPLCPANVGMKVTASLYKNGQEVASGSTGYFTSGTKKVSLSAFTAPSSSSITWKLNAVNFLYEGGHSSYYLYNTPKTCKSVTFDDE